jgi:hypothetical protein
MSAGIAGLELWPIYEPSQCLQPVSYTLTILSYLEDGLHLRELWVWVLAREHLYDQAAHAPDVSLLRISSLFDHLGRHPEHRALERGPVSAVARKEIWTRHHHLIRHAKPT